MTIVSSPAANAAVASVADEGLFQLVDSFPFSTPPALLTRSLAALGPEVILLDLTYWQSACELIPQLRAGLNKAAILGFGPRLTEEQQTAVEEAGITGILRDPFGPKDMEDATHWVLHQLHPPEHPNLIAFLPSKAGSGSSTTALNTAAALANELGKKTLLIEADRRSGVLSITLDVEARGGLPAILAESGQLSLGEWHQHLETIGKLDLLLANPLRPGPQPTWANYYHIFNFVKTQYEAIFVDLPELINPATTELALAARTVFIVCEPELASLRMVHVRRMELEAAGIPSGRICVLANRWEPRRLTKSALEAITQIPMYAALPNDYQEVKDAAIESRLVRPGSAFGKACAALARRISGAPQAAPEGRVASLLRRFGKSE